MSNYIELKIDTADMQQKEMLVALLSAAGANGFEEEKSQLIVFFPEYDYNAKECKKIIEQNGLIYYESIIEDRNWNAEWEADFKPVQVGSFCAIRAAFHEPLDAVRHEIIITPKMSFGTGHHATTHMMVQAMEGLNFAGKSVFDFGTGTGILAILAEKCGAKNITAIDNDEWSISNAVENFNSNNCRKILLKNDYKIDVDRLYDIILANINRNVILQNLLSLKQHLAGNGVVLLSGLLTGDEALILEEARKHNLKLEQRFEMNGWICLQMVSSQ